MSPRRAMTEWPRARNRAASTPDPARPTANMATGSDPGALTTASTSPPMPQRCGLVTAMTAAAATAASAAEPPCSKAPIPAMVAS